MRNKMESETLVANFNGDVINLSDGKTFFEINKTDIFELYCFMEDILEQLREENRGKF